MKKDKEFGLLIACYLAAFCFIAVLVWSIRVEPYDYQAASKPIKREDAAQSAVAFASPRSTAVLSQTGSGLSGPSTSQSDASMGAELYAAHCAACHQADASGKVGFAPSIRNRDFLALASNRFIRDTVYLGRPGTAMVGRKDLSGKQVDAIIAYLRTEPHSKIEVDPSLRFEGDWEQGSEKYNQFCSQCHGLYGQGYAAGVPGTAIGLSGFLNVASDDYILQTLKRGRIGTPMQSFIGAAGLANLSEQDAKDIIVYLRHMEKEGLASLNQEAAGPPDPVRGKRHFDIHCMSCHQESGVGKVGFAPSIRNRDFLALASDEFIRATIHDGRPGTAMLARPDLTEDVVDDILAYLRDLPVLNPIHVEINPNLKVDGDTQAGKLVYDGYCASCHGVKGEGYAGGYPGPAIGYPGLATASDDYILKTLQIGRIGTPMKPFLGSAGLANLSENEAHHVVAYLRQLQSEPLEANPNSTQNEYE